ncbi:XdhC/CoxI family protein [Streptomyces sp. NPDC088194]|uniref:XdhC family protein n=1 Tax=Streptomyces sp. NPDC088194 TaxID=3154931 RepID=UPI00344D835A
MRDIAEELATWYASGQAFAVASVVGVSGSAPREPGAALAVNAEGDVVGSVSGGCVEGAVYESCREAIASNRPALERYGYSDEDAFAVGLSCGGTIEVFVQPVLPDPVTPDIRNRAACGHGADGRHLPQARPPVASGLAAALTAIIGGVPVAVARVIRAPDGLSDLLGRTVVVGAGPDSGVSDALGAAVAAQARAMLDAGRTGRLVRAPDGLPCEPHDEASGITFFVESYAPAPRMLVFGAIDFAAAVAGIGAFLGFHVTVCDARPTFVTARRFPAADQVVADWPHRYLDAEYAAGRLDSRTVVCVLTHDTRFDVPLLTRALRLPLGYVGAIGSRRTHRHRLDRLREAGLGDTELAHLRSPIGLDLGARTPEETAVAVAAEIVAHRRGGGCLPLSATDTPIHHEPSRHTIPTPERAARQTSSAFAW